MYASLPGFGLSRAGRLQAEAAARHLAQRTVVAVISSPLQRALETAVVLADDAVVEDVRLTEWGLADRWAGLPWGEIPDRFPGEIDAYHRDPFRLPFSPEPLADVARRVAAAVRDHARAHPGGDLVLVSHQDPIQAGLIMLTGRAPSEFPTDKPHHCTIISLSPGTLWREAGRWTPAPDLGGAPFPPPP